MASFSLTFSTVRARAGTGSTMPVLDLATASRAATLATSTSSQTVKAVGGGDWTAPSNGFIRVVCDGDVDVAAGAAPVASATAGFRLPTGQVADFSISAGHKVAVRNA